MWADDNDINNDDNDINDDDNDINDDQRAAGAEIWAHELAAQWMEANTNPDMVMMIIN